MIGILLVNLGTPDSPHPKDVKRYLIEFLTDGRVIDVPWLLRQWLVRGVIVPKRYKASAQCYKEIWTEQGSPLMVYGRKLQKLLQDHLGEGYLVELSMRYQNPSIESALNSLLVRPLDELIVLPLFPQYASATTGSVHQKVMESLKRYQTIPRLKFIDSFASHPALIEAFCSIASEYDSSQYDHFLFSYHGLPERQLRKADYFGRCLSFKDCCSAICDENRSCYAAQCHQTTRGIVERLGIPSDSYSICFQSRLGKEPWLQPYASDVLKSLAEMGKKRVLVFCPSFVCDCLETIYEIGVEYAKEFKHAGGERLDLVRGLNDHHKWVEAVQQIIN